MDPTATPGTRVILFRTPTPDDIYISTFQGAGYDPACIPVLGETYETDELEKELRNGGDGWDGVVLSSKRGAEGWVKAAGGVDTIVDSVWSTVPLYAVGNSTLEVMSRSNLPAHLLPELAETRVAKSAQDLIPILVQQPTRGSGSNKRWLILRGDKSLEQISTALRETSRPFKEVIVYRTLEDPLLYQRLETLNGEGWVVFFAPSSAGMVLDHLSEGQGGHFTSTSPSKARRIKGYRIAAIGQTTRKSLEDRGLEVDTTAESPNAEGLLRAIQEADVDA